MKCLSAASRTKCRKLDDYPTPAKAIAVKLSVLTHLHTHIHITHVLANRRKIEFPLGCECDKTFEYVLRIVLCAVPAEM